MKKYRCSVCENVYSPDEEILKLCKEMGKIVAQKVKISS